MEVGDVVNVELERILANGKGIAFINTGEMLYIDGVTEEDTSVAVKILKRGHKTFFAMKMNEALPKKNPGRTPTIISSPYEVDDDEPEENDE